MPQKHSRNNTDRAAFTYQEKQMVGWGTQKTRIGTDSQQPFGYCCLTLKPVVDPVVSPSGHVYSREAIVEYLLTKTQELKRQRLVYEQQQHDKQDEAVAAGEDEKEKEAQRFIEKQTAAASAGAVAGQGHGPSAEKEKREKYIAQQLSKAIHTDLKTKRENVKKTSFWVPVCTPQAEDTGIDKPDKRPRSPMTGDPLRAKDLLPLPLMADPDWKDEHDGRGKFLCAVSRKPITSQPTVLIKSTGVVLLESIAKELAYPTMTCPVTGKKFKESDLLHLKGGGTGFSASGEVEAKKHRVTHF